MKSTISDIGTKIIVENQLKLGRVQWLELTPFIDIICQENHQFAVFSTTIATEDGVVIDAWVVTIMGNSAYYNQDFCPKPYDAVCQHIGMLAMQGKIAISDIPDYVECKDDEIEQPPGFDVCEM